VVDGVPGESQHVLLFHSRLLGERLNLVARLRFGAALGIVAGALVAVHVVGVRGLRVRDLVGVGLSVFIYNLAVFFAVRPFRRQENALVAYPRLLPIAHLSIALDYLALTYTIWLVGGSRSPFLSFYVLHAVFASAMLSRRSAFAHATAGYLLLAALMVGEWQEWIPHLQPLGAVAPGTDTDVRLLVTRLFAYGVLIEGTTFLTTGITRLLRDGELRLREAADELKRLAALRRSFVHVVMHDLRTPVGAAITLLDSVQSGLGGPEDRQRWIDRAHARLRSALDLMGDLRVLADLETEPLRHLMQPVDLMAVIRSAVDEQADLAQQRRQNLQTRLPGALPSVTGIERLLRQAVANYISNAIKYSGEGSDIVVQAYRVDGRVRVAVTDNGPGLSPAEQTHLFHEFVRANRRVAGTGLGLSIVRRVAEEHGGKVGVTSQPGRGSTFWLELPITPPTVAP
jgi:signal transduction histidine kinase